MTALNTVTTSRRCEDDYHGSLPMTCMNSPREHHSHGPPDGIAAGCEKRAL